MKQIIEKVFTNFVILSGAKNLNLPLTLALSRKGRGKNILCAKHTVKNLSTYRLNVLKTDKTPHPNPLPQGAREKHAAFTLAEVLITLGIIGIVAVLTIAPMVQKYQEKVIVTQLKKSTNIMRQAIIAAVSEHGTPDTWFAGMPPQEATEVFVNNVKPYLNVTKTCNAAYPGGVYDKYCAYEKSSYMGYISLFLTDGTVWYIKIAVPGCYTEWYYPYKMCSAGGDGANLSVDVNGKRGKNKLGYDIFNFYLTTEASLAQYLWPAGNRRITNNNQQQFPRDCRWDIVSSREGLGCTAWVLTNENMDYLHCPEKLGWNKAHSCKDAGK